MPDLSRDECIDLMAQIIEGLAVPVSIGLPLGTAQQPWDEITHKLGLFGWVNSKEIKSALEKVL